VAAHLWLCLLTCILKPSYGTWEMSVIMDQRGVAAVLTERIPAFCLPRLRAAAAVAWNIWRKCGYSGWNSISSLFLPHPSLPNVCSPIHYWYHACQVDTLYYLFILSGCEDAGRGATRRAFRLTWCCSPYGSSPSRCARHGTMILHSNPAVRGFSVRHSYQWATWFGRW